MIDLPETVALPIKMDKNGTLHVRGTRVTLDTLIARYQQGDTPEMIHNGFPAVPLTDIYAVIAYYLGHQAEPRSNKPGRNISVPCWRASTKIKNRNALCCG